MSSQRLNLYKTQYIRFIGTPIIIITTGDHPTEQNAIYSEYFIFIPYPEPTVIYELELASKTKHPLLNIDIDFIETDIKIKAFDTLSQHVLNYYSDNNIHELLTIIELEDSGFSDFLFLTNVADFRPKIDTIYDNYTHSKKLHKFIEKWRGYKKPVFTGSQYI